MRIAGRGSPDCAGLRRAPGRAGPAAAQALRQAASVRPQPLRGRLHGGFAPARSASPRSARADSRCRRTAIRTATTGSSIAPSPRSAESGRNSYTGRRFVRTMAQHWGSAIFGRGVMISCWRACRLSGVARAWQGGAPEKGDRKKGTDLFSLCLKLR